MLGENFWKQYFKVYDVLNLVIPYRNLMIELEKELELTFMDSVLDVGSGTGNFMIRIKNKANKIIGIDYSKEGIKMHKLKDSSANVILHDITKRFPFPDEHFSKVVSNNTIYALSKDQQEKVLLEIYRVMRPGGKVVISNVKKDYSPLKIYLKHISRGIKLEGFFATVRLIIRMIIPTIRMFYYNAKIKKSGLTNSYNFLSPEAQKDLLKRAGFKNISEGKYIFAEQAIINSAYKL